MSPTSALSSSASTTTTKAARIGWTKIAVEAAKSNSKAQRAKLEAAGVLNIPRPIQITAKAYDPTGDSVTNTLDKNTKIIHFQRHGQGYHNLIGDVVRELGNKINLEDSNSTTNPFIRPEIIDSPLTSTGLEECSSWRTTASLLSPDVIIISPLLRTIQTAMATFADFKTNVPWVAHEGCREELGYLTCNQRRPISHSQAEFPSIDFSNIEDDQDSLWMPDRFETALEKTDRGYHFMVDFVRKRPEKELAIVTHSAFLFNLFNAVMDCGGDEDLQAWFLTSEIRSLCVTFHDEK